MEGFRLKMKNLFRVVFRDVPSSVLLIVGFGLTIFIAMLGSDIVNSIIKSQKSDNGELYKYYLEVYHADRVSENYGDGQLTYVDEDAKNISYSDIYNIMYNSGVNFYNQGFVDIGEGQEQQFMATSIISFDKTQPFALIEGYVDWSDKNTVIIGETIINYVTTIDNKKYLLVNGVYYEVTGILENTGSVGYDSSIYFVNNKIRKNVPDIIYSEIEDSIMFGLNTNLVVFADNEKILNKINIIKNEMEEKLRLRVSFTDKPLVMEEKDITNRLYEKLNKIFLPLFMIFCIGSCCSISSLWVKVRKTDIAIRLTYGFSNFKMYRWILKELSILIAIALLCLLVLRSIYFMMFSGVLINKASIECDILIISGAVIITLMITSFRAYLYSKLIVPAEVLKEL